MNVKVKAGARSKTGNLPGQMIVAQVAHMASGQHSETGTVLLEGRLFRDFDESSHYHAGTVYRPPALRVRAMNQRPDPIWNRPSPNC
jgi:hypothetical protein